MIVTIDGPAGAGKSSAARKLAERLAFDFLNTGAMYRAVALAGLRDEIDWHDTCKLEAFLDQLHLEMPPGRVLLNAEDITSQIRSAEVTAGSGIAANSPTVRRRLVAWQRQIAQGRRIVCEGRDQGTIVFPDALCKFFLFADPVERAHRRRAEQVARGVHVSFEEVLQAQHERDARDAARTIAPMVPADDALLLDSTKLSPTEVVDRMEHEVRLRMTQKGLTGQ